jgi:hypothetical protein
MNNSIGQKQFIIKASYRAAVLLLICLLNSGCHKKSVVALSAATLPGTYVGKYANGQVETFILNPDRTYFQSLASNGTILYTNQGRWEINGGSVVFNNVYLAMDVWNLNKGQPVKTGVFRAFWDSNVPSIVFSDDRHFWVDKQSENPDKKP